MFAPTDLRSQERWLPVKNAAGETIPAFAVMRVTGLSDGVVTVAKPNADDQDPAILIINCDAEIPVGGYGQGSYERVVRALYDAGDGTPAFGEVWGAGDATWKLRKDKVGFRTWGLAGGTGVAVASRGYRALYDVNCDSGLVGTKPSA